MTKDSSASTEPAADLALVKRLRQEAEELHGVLAPDSPLGEAAAAIERLLRERDEVITSWRRNRRELMTERDAALRERDELTRRLKGDVGDVFLDEIHGDV